MALAAALRLAVAFSTVDAPGDGPTRAALGRQWVEAPRLVRDGHWLPFGEVMVGLANLLVPDPLWAARAPSLVTGSLSPLLLAVLAAGLWGRRAGLAAGLLLALSPIHVALSASALIDAPSLGFLLLALLASRRLAGAERPVRPLLGLALAGALATGTRYESWLLLPVVALHQLLAHGRPGRTTLAFLALLPVPVFWTATALGGPAGLLDAFAYVTASGAAVGGAAVSPLEGLRIAALKLLALLGPATATLAPVGLLAGLAAGGRAARAEAAAGLLLLAGFLALLVALAIGRGPSLVDRYALDAAVLALPLATAAVREALRPARRGLALALALAGSTALATWAHPPQLYLQRAFPPEVVELARFLDRERPAGAALLFTRAGWLSTYVPLLHPLGREEYRIVSWYLPDTALRDFLRRARPRLLITRPGDEALLERVRAAGGEPGPPFARFRALEVRPLALPERVGAD